MRVIMFQERFHEGIRDGTKGSTIRLKAHCKPGDVLSLRKWEGGKPYRRGTKRVELRSVVCALVRPIRLKVMGIDDCRWLLIAIAGHDMPVDERDVLAQGEGFTNLAEMTDWFMSNHNMRLGDTLEADFIEWESDKLCAN